MLTSFRVFEWKQFFVAYTPCISAYTQIKLEGMPWDTVDKKESCKSKYLVCQIIKLLADNQYYLYANSNLKSTTDTLFFQYEKDLPGIFFYHVLCLVCHILLVTSFRGLLQNSIGISE